MTIDRNRYDADLDIPDTLPGATETYIRPLADLHEATAREPRDVILLLAIRETFALYGAAVSTDDERDYLREDVACILALDPDSKVDPTQIRNFLLRYLDEHDPDGREAESMEWAWRLLLCSNRKFHERLLSHYSTTPYAGAQPRLGKKRAS